MRRLLTRHIAALILVAVIALPASAAPGQDGSNPSLFERIVKIIRHILPLEDFKIDLPKP